MTASARRLIVGLLLVAGVTWWFAPGRAAAQITGDRGGTSLPVSDCTPSAGVLVAVDFGHWGGPVVRGCTVRAANALAGMHAAGFLTAGDQANGAAFVCRIGVAAEGASSERPTPAADPCVATPAATAYWSFWYATAGQSRWSYSPSGAATFSPAAGSVEAWVFGAGAPPSVTPADLRSRPPATTTTTATTTTAATSTTGPPQGAPTTTAPATHAATAPTTGHPKSPATTARSRPRSRSRPRPAASSTTTLAPGTAAGATRSTSSSSSSSTTTTRIVDAAAGNSSSGSSSPGGGPGSPAGLIAGAAAVVVLGGAGGAMAWRRRRAV